MQRGCRCGHGIRPFEHLAFVWVECQHQLGRSGGASVKALGGIEVHSALVSDQGVRLTSHPTQQITLAVRPPGLIRFPFLDQLIEVERLGEPTSLECLAELSTKIDGLALGSTHLFVCDPLP